MTLDQLKNSINNAAWFSRLGQFGRCPNMIPIREIEADGMFDVIIDFDYPEGPDVEWEWLPTQRDQPDPFHGNKLVELAASMGKQDELREVTLDIYKLCCKVCDA
jgi:hypothetical protein